jgi:hypothetical protein
MEGKAEFVGENLIKSKVNGNDLYETVIQYLLRKVDYLEKENQRLNSILLNECKKFEDSLNSLKKIIYRL